MKICYLLTDSVGFKTYLDIKPYTNKYKDIELFYHFINDDTENSLFNMHKFPIFRKESFTYSYSRFVEEYFGFDPYGFYMDELNYLQSILIPLKRYIKNENILEDFYDELSGTKVINEEIISQINNIPYADLYLVSDRQKWCYGGLFYIICYLHKKYPNSKIILGGGRYHNIKTLFYKLYQEITKYYLPNFEYVVGNIGPMVENYYLGNDYHECWDFKYYDGIEEIDKDLYNNVFAKSKRYIISYSNGCNKHCTFCVGPNLNKLNICDDITCYNEQLKYISKNYPNLSIDIFSNKLNYNKNIFKKIIKNFIDLNLNNTIQFFIDFNKDIDEELMELLKYPKFRIEVSSDIYTEKESKIFSRDEYINKLILFKTNGVNIDFVSIVSNIPNDILLNKSKSYLINLFINCLKYNIKFRYNEFILMLNSYIWYNYNDYELSFKYFKNNDKYLNKIENILNKIPIYMYRKDMNRKDMVNWYDDFLYKIYILKNNNFYNENRFCEQIYIDKNLLNLKSNYNRNFKFKESVDSYIENEIL